MWQVFPVHATKLYPKEVQKADKMCTKLVTVIPERHLFEHLLTQTLLSSASGHLCHPDSTTHPDLIPFGSHTCTFPNPVSILLENHFCSFSFFLFCFLSFFLSFFFAFFLFSFFLFFFLSFLLSFFFSFFLFCFLSFLLSFFFSFFLFFFLSPDSIQIRYIICNTKTIITSISSKNKLNLHQIRLSNSRTTLDIISNGLWILSFFKIK